MITSVIEEVRRDIYSYDACPDPDVLDHLILQLDIINSHLVFVRLNDHVLQAVKTAVKALTHLNDGSACVIPTSHRGRPRLDVSEEQLVHLLSPIYMSCNCINAGSFSSYSTAKNDTIRTQCVRFLLYNL